MLRKTSKEIQMLEELQKKEWETGQRILRDPDRQKLEDAIEQEHTVDNLTMTRCIDYMVSLLGRAYGFGLNTVRNDDRNSVSNNVSGAVLFASSTNSWSEQFIHGLFPEIIGIGKGITPPTITNTTLDDDFNDYASRPDNITYRNTYNSKFGGYVKPGLTFKDDYISQYAYLYGPDEINSLRFPIFEIGLFAPEIHIGAFRIHPTGNQILFSNNPLPPILNYDTNNRLWSGLNVSHIQPGIFFNQNTRFSSPATGIVSNGFYVTRGPDSQIITVLFGGNSVDSRAIVAFTPHWKSLSSPLGWGINRNFQPSELLARAVLPMGFIKNQNYSLTVLWQIYFNRM